MQKRSREIKIRLTEDEYQKLQDLKTKTQLAVWLRELALNQNEPKPQSETDRALIYEINQIGKNLNQITKFIHLNQTPLSKDFLNIIEQIQNELRTVLNDR